MTTRRELLRNGLAFGGAAALPGFLPGLGAMAQTSAGANDYKALVCVFLFGAMDSFDTVVPFDRPSYNEWSTTRGQLLRTYDAAGIGATRARSGLRALEARNARSLGGRQFALVPQMGEVADLFAEGNAAIVGGVGPLLAPTSKRDVDTGRAQLPPRLFSHNDQQSLWQTSDIEGAQSGWGGRMADALLSANRSSFTTVSARGAQTFLTGANQSGIELASTRLDPVAGTSGSYLGNRTVGRLLEEHLSEAGAGSSNLFARDYRDAQASGVATTNRLSGLLNGTTDGEDVALGANPLAAQLAVVAKLISLRQALGVRRQVFMVSLGGFDTHAEQAMDLPGLQRTISSSVNSFYRWTERSGLADNVTTFTASDFGRTLQPNDSGTDHGWGSHHMVVGGAVRGGQVLGEMAPSVLGHDQDIGRGRLIPSVSIEQYGGAMGRWLGVSENGLRDVFPRYGRFDQQALGLF